MEITGVEHRIDVGSKEGQQNGKQEPEMNRKEAGRKGPIYLGTEANVG